MSRIAFIIGHPASVYGTLQGVRHDKANYQNFLTSDAGGAWESSEINLLDKPAKNELEVKLIQGMFVDFTVVVFAGHGCHKKADGNTYVCANDREDIPIWKLNTGAKRQLIIIDACRTFLQEELLKAERGYVFEREKIAAVSYRRSCRVRYDQAVSSAEEGIETLYACSPGQSAQEDADRGGLFSSSLIKGAVAWAEANRPGTSPASAVLTVQDALNIAKQTMFERRYPQVPMGDYGRRRYHLPFAVA